MSLVTMSPVPSGSHSGSNTPSARLVSRRASPPRPAAPQLRAFLAGGTKASVRPSGRPARLPIRFGAAVSWRAEPLATSASQMRVMPGCP